MAALTAPNDELAALAYVEKAQYVHNLKHSSSKSDVSVVHEPDGIHDGLEFPTEEEKLSLRRVADKVPWNAYCSLILSLCGP